MAYSSSSKTALHVKGTRVRTDATLQASSKTMQQRHQGVLALVCHHVWQVLLSFLTWPDILDVTLTNPLAKSHSMTMLGEALLNAPIPVAHMLFDIAWQTQEEVPTLRRHEHKMRILWEIPDYERLQRGFETLGYCFTVTPELLIRFMLRSLQREHTGGVPCVAELSIRCIWIQHALRSLGLDDRSLKLYLNHAICCFASTWRNTDVDYACLRTIVCTMLKARHMSKGKGKQQLRRMQCASTPQRFNKRRKFQ